LGRSAVEEPFHPVPPPLRFRGLHRLRGERPNLPVLADREGFAGLLEEGLGVADGPAPFLRVPDAGLGLFETRVEGVLPAFVEAPEGDPFQEALGEGDIGRILAGPADVFLGRRDGRLHLAGARLDRRRLIKRLPARIAVRPAVRDVGFAERAAGHGSPMGCPSDMEGDDSFECRVSGYKSRVFGILPDNYMARTASARLSEKLQYAPRLPSARSD